MVLSLRWHGSSFKVRGDEICKQAGSAEESRHLEVRRTLQTSFLGADLHRSF